MCNIITIIRCVVPEIQSEIDRLFCNFGPFLTPNPPPPPRDNPRNQSFEKLKNITGDIIIVHMCNINNNHMMYDFCEKECNIICPPNDPENQNFEKMKKMPQILSFYTCVP